MEDIDGGQHPAVDGQSLGRKVTAKAETYVLIFSQISQLTWMKSGMPQLLDLFKIMPFFVVGFNMLDIQGKELRTNFKIDLMIHASKLYILTSI